VNTELVKGWRAALDACTARGGETRPLVIEPPATASRVADVERALGHALPARLRRFFLEEAASVQFQWFLPTSSEPPFIDTSSGGLSISLEAIVDLATQHGRRGRIAFQLVANGDLVAIDVRKPGEPVVFLSHEGGDGDGVVLGRDLDDYLARHAALGYVGPEDWQWLPFVSEIDDERILDPDGDAADRWRRWFGLPLRTEAAAAAAADRAAAAAKRASEAAAWQSRADASAPKTVDELRARLARVSWCARCGQGPTPLDLPFPAVWLSSWDEVKARMAATSWENAKLEAQNELTLWLHNNAHDEYQSWNERSTRVKAGLVAELEPVWKRRQEEVGLQLVSGLRWIVMGMAMELDYLSFGHPARFFLNLLPVFEAGHLPCGWKGRRPRGELAVF
jgi:hypothetical protein